MAGMKISTEGKDGWFEGDWIQTFTGKRFYTLDPKAEDICIEDVAHALSFICRYNGHCSRFYSVAEHSILLAVHARRSGRSSAQQMHALLHDASEAYTSDVPRPIKNSIPEIRDVEKIVDHVVLKSLGVPESKDEWLEDADRRICLDEKAALMGPPNDGTPWMVDGLEPLGVRIMCYGPEEAEANFLRVYAVLKKETDDACD